MIVTVLSEVLQTVERVILNVLSEVFCKCQRHKVRHE